MPSFKLSYFDFYGRGEAIRYIFHLAGVEYEENLVNHDDLPKLAPSLPYGQLPTLEVDGKIYWQTVSICRYLGNHFGLGGTTEEEKLMMDVYVDGANDLWAGMGGIAGALFGSGGDLEAEKKKFFDGPFKKFATKYSEFIKGDWIVGNKVSWADAYIADHLKRIQVTLDEHCLDSYPVLKAYSDRFHAIPNIQKYIAGRPKRPI